MSFSPNTELNFSPIHGGERISSRNQLPCYQSEQITGFGPRINPDSIVSSSFEIPRCNDVAVAQKYRIRSLISNNANRVLGKDIWAIREINNVSKPFRLALRAKIATALVKTIESGVVLGFDSDHNSQSEWPRGRNRYAEKARGKSEALS